ncbi:MAG TPA: TIGR00366 family protein [Candidatus Aquilonibacter sp.]|nr:TIGR00366 family protein [Candidatus Aquilonibacter sp.]
MRSISGFFVRVFEYAVPDPYVFAVLLSLMTAALALVFAPHHSFTDIAGAWYKGIFDIFEFALQMILILVTGYALASSRPIERALQAIASRVSTTRSAVVVTFLVSAVACWLNWGFGLVVAGLLARTIARRVTIDFGWLVAAAYGGFLIWASGLSSSIALAQATPGSKLNIVQSLTGTVLPLSQTIFTRFNLVPVLVLLAIVPMLFIAFEPRAEDRIVATFPPDEEYQPAAPAAATLGARLDGAWILNLALVVSGFAYLIVTWSRHGFSLPIQSVIFIFLLLGLLLHWTPVAYVRAINDAARVTGPLLIQYPLYGGIMGMMTGTGLAAVIAAWFVSFSTAGTLPFWSYLSSVVISLFVPSGGGHWAVQGPFVVPAAAKLGASQAATAMGVAIGEEVANMIQPFWCLPILAIAGIGLRRVMAFTAMIFFVALVVFGASLLWLAPK